VADSNENKLNIVDSDACTACAACVEICPHRVIELAEPDLGKRAVARTAPGRGRHCIDCGQCVAVCPTGSMALPNLEPGDLEPLHPWGFDDDAFLRFLRARRSVRVFEDRPVDRDLINRVLEAAACAPMGFPPHTTEVLVIDRRQELDHLLERCLTAYRRLVREYRSPFIRQIMKLNVGSEMMSALGRHVISAVENNNALYDTRGEDRYLYRAPALLLFHASRRATKYDDNALIVATHAMLAAHALGLGATLLGITGPVINRDKALRRRYDIPADSDVVTSMILGHPSVRYHRALHRSLKRVRYH